MIPRILHQTWKSSVVPKAFASYMESWRRLHRGWTFKLWTDEDLAGFVEARYPQYGSLFRTYPLSIMRADLGRYLILREFGGVYADLDAEAVSDFEPYRSSEVPIFAYEPDSHAALEFVRNRGFAHVVSNAVILSPVGHPFWDYLLQLLRRCRYASNPLDATGPFVLTAAVEQGPAESVPAVMPAHVFSPVDKFGQPVDRNGSNLKTLAVHHWAGTWWKPQSSTTLAAQPARNMSAEVLAASAADAERFLSSIDSALVNAESPKTGNVLIAFPVRDAADSLDFLFERLLSLDYPHDKLSLSFLEGDSGDDSFEKLRAFAEGHVSDFRRIVISKHDFGISTPSPRWAPSAQRSRRSHIAKVRNELVNTSLRDEDWVLWIDADVVRFPKDIITALMSTGAKIVHPNAVRFPGGPSMDLNAWTVERELTAEAIAAWISDGLYQPPKGFERLYLSDLRYRDEVPLHGVGGTMLLVDAGLHRAGLVFPEVPYRFLIETEGLGMAARDLGVIPVGLPNVEVVHSPR